MKPKGSSELDEAGHKFLADFRDMLAQFADAPYRQTEYKIIDFVLADRHRHAQSLLTAKLSELLEKLPRERDYRGNGSEWNDCLTEVREAINNMLAETRGQK